MDGEDDGLVDWLLEQIADTAYIERLEFIAECIATDAKCGDAYTKDVEAMKRLRAAWATKKKELEEQSDTAGSMPNVQGESTD